MSTRHCLVVGTHDGGQDIDLPPHQDLLPGGGHHQLQGEHPEGDRGQPSDVRKDCVQGEG